MRGTIIKLAGQFVPVHARSYIPFTRRNSNIQAWKRFSKQYRQPDSKMLANLDKLEKTILIGGCQRSGGTMLTDHICQTEGIESYCPNGDRELAGALMLAGEKGIDANHRWCFQTSYLNEHYLEYFDDYDFKLVWLIRNPHSVIRSMVFNWSRFALQELYLGCREQTVLFPAAGVFETRQNIDKACYIYLAKLAQLNEISTQLSKRLLVLDYDDIILSRALALEELYGFVDLKVVPESSSKVHDNSLVKAEDLNKETQQLIDDRCSSAYRAARKLRSPIWSQN